MGKNQFLPTTVILGAIATEDLIEKTDSYSINRSLSALERPKAHFTFSVPFSFCLGLLLASLLSTEARC